MRKIFLPIAVFLLIPLMLLVSLMQLSYLSFAKIHGNNFRLLFGATPPNTVAYAALPTTMTSLNGGVTLADARTLQLSLFFKGYHSALQPYAATIVMLADKYHIPWKLVPAISMQESIGCKRAPAGSYNCFGYDIYAHHVRKFKNYYEAIDTVSKALSKYYIAKGINTPEEIQKFWNPSNNGNWSSNIEYFEAQI